MAMDRSDALRKYQSLRKMTVARGATAAEADTAQGLADRLAARFGFTSADDAAPAASSNPFGVDWDDILRRARQAAAARQAREAREQAEAQRQAREEAVRRAHRARQQQQAREQARAGADAAHDEQAEWNRQWWYDYNAARRTWHWELRKCGKSNCWCRRADVRLGQGHGPYRFSKKRTGKKVSSIYLGRAGGGTPGQRPD